MIVSTSPPLHSNKNVLGLSALGRFGLHITDNYFDFDNLTYYV